MDMGTTQPTTDTATPNTFAISPGRSRECLANSCAPWPMPGGSQRNEGFGLQGGCSAESGLPGHDTIKVRLLCEATNYPRMAMSLGSPTPIVSAQRPQAELSG